MPSPPNPDPPTSLSRTNHSNTNVTAQTAAETVMAEQNSHNVVDSTQSTSASALVDVAANQTDAASAEHGALEQQALPQTKSDEVRASDEINAQAAAANASASTQLSAADAAAEPSAGEATARAAEASEATPELIAPTSDANLVDGDGGVVNGGDVAADDGVAPEGSVDVSLNSDTEDSRGDASESKKEDGHHQRTNSVKKPTTFSKVSVTKNFLAKSASGTPPLAKPADKPSTAGTPPTLSTAKPRLIAKTGASLQPKSGLRTEGSSGPDASKVWNKNRPVPPPPPKQFTDEELKQQYGIHLATRLQTDENGKESKWADIDDDEDDWAPDTVVWMDGTKSTLTPQETANAQKELNLSTPQPQKPVEAVRPVLALKRPTELGPMKTILKPGASAAAAQAKQNGPSPATSTEKPSLKSSSPAPPTKSPWAALPPVEKVSPVNPPVQQAQSGPPKLAPQDARAYEPAPPQQPPREMAADTFDRSWREGEGGARELFNSANGRYELVTDGRRSSIKPDSAYRKPALLQRASQTVISPAEPSAAFQTRSENQTDGAWMRRRGSSVSHGSMPSVRRVSTSKGSDMSHPSERRTSTVIGHDMGASPRLARNEPTQPVFSQQTAWQQQMPQRPEPGNEEEDPVKVQERVMREKRELAKKRREEEEKRAEAEKQERLKARLAQLEGAGKSRKEREAEAAAAAAAATTPPSDKPPELTSSTSQTEQTRAQPSQPAETSAVVAPALEAQSLPPAPTESQQEQFSTEDRMPSPLPPKPPVTALPDRPISSADQNQRQQVRPHLSPRANARAPFQTQPSPYAQATSYSSSPSDRKPQPFGRSPIPGSDTFTPWPMSAPNANVWGSSGIGNGTFESASTFAPMQQTSGLPPPPGMGTRPTQPSRISPPSLAQGTRSPNLQQQSLPESHRGFAPPGFGDQYNSQMRVNGASPSPGPVRQPHAPGPIAPPSRAHLQQQQQHASSQQDSNIGRWQRAAGDLPQQYQTDQKEAAEKARQRTAPAAPRDDTVKETFKKTSAQQGRLGAPRKYDLTEYTIHDGQGSRSVQSLSPVPPHSQTQSLAPLPTTSPLPNDPWQQAGQNTVRIPDAPVNAPRGGAVQQPPIAPPGVQSLPPHARAQRMVDSLPRPLSPYDDDLAPPPAENSLHPVNSGSTGQPLVRLPPGRPVVKLPPAPPSAAPQAPGGPQQTVMMPQRPISHWGAPSSSRPLVQQEAWQARFNGLFGRTPTYTEVPPSPPKTPPKSQGPALAVAASSRTVMDELPTANVATVVLPQAKKNTTAEGFTIDESSDIVSKPTVAEVFAEERSMGSTPDVSVPRKAVYPHPSYNITQRPVFGPSHRSNIDVRSSFEFNMLDLHHRRREGIFVHLPLQKLRNKLVHRPAGSRKPSGQITERATSAKSSKGKGKEAPPSPAPTNGITSSSTQSDKVSAPEQQASATNDKASSNESRRRERWPKPPKGGRRPYQPRAVTAGQ